MTGEGTATGGREPGWSGLSPFLAAVLLLSGLAASGEDPTVMRVEALVREADRPLVVEYGVLVEGEVTTVELAAASEALGQVGPISLQDRGQGRYVGEVAFPGPALWTVKVTTPASGPVRFAENLPWPHYTTEAGFPKVKVDVGDPSLEGTLLRLEESSLFGPRADDRPILALALAGAVVVSSVLLWRRRTRAQVSSSERARADRIP